MLPRVILYTACFIHIGRIPRSEIAGLRALTDTPVDNGQTPVRIKIEPWPWTCSKQPRKPVDHLQGQCLESSPSWKNSCFFHVLCSHPNSYARLSKWRNFTTVIWAFSGHSGEHLIWAELFIWEEERKLFLRLNGHHSLIGLQTKFWVKSLHWKLLWPKLLSHSANLKRTKLLSVLAVLLSYPLTLLLLCLCQLASHPPLVQMPWFFQMTLLMPQVQVILDSPPSLESGIQTTVEFKFGPELS